MMTRNSPALHCSLCCGKGHIQSAAEMDMHLVVHDFKPVAVEGLNEWYNKTQELQMSPASPWQG